MGDGMSDYEKLRLANIARNEAALAQLQIPRMERVSTKKKTSAVKRSKRDTVTPGRRSSRIAAGPRRSMKDGVDQQDDDSDYEDNLERPGGDDDTNEDDEDEEYSRPRRRRRSSAAVPRAGTDKPTVAQQSAPPLSGSQTTVLSVELAKTGRSKCRGCFEAIAAGSPRVGMTAWIMGRQSMTWSHPQCCINRLIVTVEVSGRGKCKLTGVPLPKDTPKIGVRSHTATSWVALPGCATVLAPVLRIVPDAERDRVHTLLGADGAPPAIEGYGDLTEDHAKAVLEALQSACAAAATGGTAIKVESTTPPQASHGSGESNKLTGRVAWKFGGATCYGTMIPSRETDTHCYATTHKGNVKTLKKGSQYWWMVEDH